MNAAEIHRLESELCCSEYDEPDFANPSKCHDWRNYVSSKLAAEWDGFTGDQKLVIAHALQQIADREEWD